MKILHVIMAVFLCLFIEHSAFANGKNKYASIIIDAHTQEILHARNIDAARYPASTTKMMTLYLVFDALERGEIHLSDPMKVSRFAAQTAPVKLGLRPGSTITVEHAIKALIVRSANDVAVVIAEHISGSQAQFSDLMTAKARALGMQSSKFTNPHGLPDGTQITTARDMAKLGDALYHNHRKYYYFFSTHAFHYAGHAYRNHNTLLENERGVDGFKTGFTNASGYNLVVSAARNGHRIIAVVLGGASGQSRDRHMVDLVNRASMLSIKMIKTRKPKFLSIVMSARVQSFANRILKTTIFRHSHYARHTNPQREL